MNAHQRIVTDPEVEKALDFLRDSSRTIGDAVKRARSAANMVKHIEALGQKASDASSSDRRQADARTSQAYLDAIAEDAEAFGELEVLKALREAAALKIEAWRTEQSNFRAMKI